MYTSYYEAIFVYKLEDVDYTCLDIKVNEKKVLSGNLQGERSMLPSFEALDPDFLAFRGDNDLGLQHEDHHSQIRCK